MNVYCICIWPNIPAGKLIQHNNNECVLYLYWTEYSGRKVRVNNTCILYLYLTEYTGRKVDTTQQQWMCIVFVLDGIFRPESWYNTTTMKVYCICFGRNIPAGKWLQNKHIVFVFDGIFRPGSKSEQYMYIVFVFDRIFRPGSWYNTNTTTMNVYVLYLYWTEYSGRKVNTTQQQ